MASGTWYPSTTCTKITTTGNGQHNTQYLGVAVDGVAVGAGVAHTDDSELHVGYAVRSVTPHASYTPRLMQSAMPTPSNACVQNISRSIHLDLYSCIYVSVDKYICTMYVYKCIGDI